MQTMIPVTMIPVTMIQTITKGIWRLTFPPNTVGQADA